MRQYVIASILFASALCGGCAHQSLSQNQCVAGDWQMVGYRDGQQGYDQTRLLTHQEACGEFGVIPDREQYVRGWHEGVAKYCRADHGFELGAGGYAYRDVCPAPDREPFLAAYAHGRDLHLARSDVQRLQGALARSHQRLETIDARVLELAAAQVAKDLTTERRVELFTQTKNLLDEKQRIERGIPGLEQELAFAMHRLDEMQRFG